MGYFTVLSLLLSKVALIEKKSRKMYVGMIARNIGFDTKLKAKNIAAKSDIVSVKLQACLACVFTNRLCFLNVIYINKDGINQIIPPK